MLVESCTVLLAAKFFLLDNWAMHVQERMKGALTGKTVVTAFQEEAQQEGEVEALKVE